MSDGNELQLADLAFSRAFEFERTNPEILLAHARLLKKHGDEAGSRKLLLQIHAGDWQPGYAHTVQQAKALLKQQAE